jgi:ubiquinone/menaquinone biosynthesis C-methylase UbiE
MGKQNEIDYLKNAGPDFFRHAAAKPFSDQDCPRYLMQMGAVLMLLPPPPARLLDLGCGSGWTSRFFAKRGYQVTGQDISPDMVALGQAGKDAEKLENLEFIVADFENLGREGQYDCAVFYDALHHAEDEEAALSAVYRALKPGGVCITVEPGDGHHDSAESRAAMEKFGVTEKNMPPKKIIRLGRKIGFRRFRTYPHTYSFCTTVYGRISRPFFRKLQEYELFRYGFLHMLLGLLFLLRRRSDGIVVLEK